MLEIRPEEHAALVDGRPLSLTMRELQLLTTLAAHPQRILTREELYAEVWGREPRHDDRSVDVYVSRLRSKLSDALPGQRPDPHPQRHRLPLFAGRLMREPSPIAGPFTSFLHPRYSQVTSCRGAAESVAPKRQFGSRTLRRYA